MKMKKVAGLITALVVAGAITLSGIPNHAEAKGGFSSFHSSSSFSRSSSFGSSSRSSSFSSPSRSSFSGRSSSYSTRTSTSKPRVSLSKSSATSQRRSSFSGSSSSRKTYVSQSSTGRFSGRTSTVTGRVATYNRPYRTYYHGHYVSVSHYYGAGYDPFMWGGYYSGFTTGMFMSSLYQPWGGVYYANGAYTHYGASPIAWIIDFILFLIILSLIIWACVALSPSRKTYVRRL